ncbi:hypothetical protein FV242_19680 [Methylobacterium sp. WL64]|uniref:hypothetical protein n=1 Tax=Methylobacterium sp. WL64 TaxID=2603894 RepID=UPI0011C97D66|nr:hypothetical protein [Methylobacterium sp. WL64]TXN01086.1 hypothetical protein FV242_19680 [Methylobacterium sp. WL64]
MTGTIVPLRLKRDEASALIRFDAAAVELLVEGQASNLSVARLDAILALLRGQRAKLVAILADLEARAPSFDTRIAGINVDLRDRTREALALIDLLIQRVQACRTTTERGLPPG